MDNENREIRTRTKTKTALSIILLLFFLPLAHALPQPVNMSADPDPNPYFEENRTYFFRIMWIGQNVSNVTIEHNFTGSLANYSMVLQNGAYLYNTTNLTPALYVWKGYALNDSGVFNATSQQNYTIRKGIPIIELLINGSTRNSTSFEPNVTINITVDLFSNKNELLNPDFESSRFNNASLPVNWFHKFIDDDMQNIDVKNWPYQPLISDNFSGSRALLVNVTRLYNGGDNPTMISSYPINVTPSTNYTLVFYARNVTFQDQVNEFAIISIVEFNENQELLCATLCGDVIYFNSTSAFNDNENYVISQSDAGNGWRKITLKFPTSANGKFIRIEPYYSYNNVSFPSHYIVDDFVLLKPNIRINKTVFINITFPGYAQQNGSSPLTNITLTPVNVSAYNVTGSFNGDANYSAGTELHEVLVGYPALVAITTNATFQQGTAAGYKVYIPFQVRYTNATNLSQVIQGATCSVTNNITSNRTALTFNSATGNYTCTGTACLDNYLLYGNVKFSAECSGNRTFAPKTNVTSSDVIFQTYLWEYTNQSYGDTPMNNTKWLRYAVPANQVNVTKNISLAVNDTDVEFIKFIVEDNSTSPNLSLDRTITFLGNTTLRANISLSNGACRPKMCFQIQDKFLNPLITQCSQAQNISSSAATLVEANITLNVTADVSNYLAFLIRCDANTTLANKTEVNMTLFYNYTALPNIETRGAVPNPIKATSVKQVQIEDSYTIGPNSAVNSTWNETIEFNNTLSQPQLFSYSMVSRVAASDKISNISISVFSSSGSSISKTFSGGIIKWTTEKISGNKKLNETVQYTVKDAIQDNETLIFQKIGESVWTANISSNLVPQMSVRGITAYTNYSAYSVLSGWTFNVTVANKSGTFDISGLVVKSANNVTFPSTNLSSVLYRINATGISTGASCASSNQCATGVCCSGVCATGCVVTTTVSSGGGGSVVYRPEPPPPDARMSTIKSLTVLLGSNKTFVVNVSGIVNNSRLVNVTLSVSGYLPGYTIVEPSIIRIINFSETKQFSITLTSPIFLTEREFDLNISVSSVFERGGSAKNITKSSKIKLVINTLATSFANATSINATLEKANLVLNEMQLAGFSTVRISSLIKDLKSSIVNEDVLKIQSTVDEIISLEERAFSIHNAIKDVEKQIEAAKNEGLSVPNTERFYNLALAAFNREDYEKADQRINSALLSASAETHGRINLAVYASRNWPFVLAGIAIMIFLGINAYRVVSIRLINRKLAGLEREETALRELSANLHVEYYQKHELSKDEFKELSARFARDMAKIRSKTAQLVERKAGIIKAENELKQLAKEHEALLGMVKALQKEYFEEEKIPKSVYETRLKEYKSRLAETAEHIELVNAKMSKETKSEKLWSGLSRMLSIRGFT